MPDEKLFNLEQAEKLLPTLEFLLGQAIEAKKKTDELDRVFEQVRNRILIYGGIVPPYGELSQKKVEHDNAASSFKDTVAHIEAQGCVIKDLDVGLIDFPAVIDEQQVYLCWKLGEERIRYWHRMDEGFAGRKPLEFGSGEEPQRPKPN